MTFSQIRDIITNHTGTDWDVEALNSLCEMIQLGAKVPSNAAGDSPEMVNGLLDALEEING